MTRILLPVTLPAGVSLERARQIAMRLRRELAKGIGLMVAEGVVPLGVLVPGEPKIVLDGETTKARETKR